MGLTDGAKLPNGVLQEELLFELFGVGIGRDMDEFDTGDTGPIGEHDGGGIEGDDGVVGASGQDPEFDGGFQIGLQFPHHAGNGEVGHG